MTRAPHEFAQFWSPLGGGQRVCFDRLSMSEVIFWSLTRLVWIPWHDGGVGQ